jgi:hypothetical protein
MLIANIREGDLRQPVVPAAALRHALQVPARVLVTAGIRLQQPEFEIPSDGDVAKLGCFLGVGTYGHRVSSGCAWQRR